MNKEAQARKAIFLSHATPEDNAFVLWLGAKLSAMGYEVWADVMQLKGGDDWSRKLEDALRNRAAKMLLVCTAAGLEKQGVRNEIQIGSDISKKLNDSSFIIPLRMESFEPHFLVAHLQYINFSQGWSAGLVELTELLETFQLPRGIPEPISTWMNKHAEGASTLQYKSEPLVSNWLEIQSSPEVIYYCKPPVGFDLKVFQNRQLHPWPIVPYREGVITFSTPNSDGLFSENLPGNLVASVTTTQFLEEGWPDLGMSCFEARNVYVDIGGQAFEKFCASRGLKGYMGSGHRLSWWPDIKIAPRSQIKFDWNFRRGSRQIIGHSPKRNIHWHYAVSAQLRTSPFHHYRIAARLIFSNNGLDAIEDVHKSHRLRRSFAKGWRNARWRDMLCAYLWWLAEGRGTLNIPVGLAQKLTVGVPPMQFGCPVSVIESGQVSDDDDDPDVPQDDFDNDFQEESNE